MVISQPEYSWLKDEIVRNNQFKNLMQNKNTAIKKISIKFERNKTMKDEIVKKIQLKK